MSDRHYLEEELYSKIQSDSRIFDFLQESSLDGLWYWDLNDPEQEWMSPQLWRLFGIDPATKTHRAAEWQDIIFPDDLAVALDNFRKHVEDPSHPYDQVVRYRHADGSTVTVRCRGMVVHDADGKPHRMLGAHNDLTKLKRIEAQLFEANAALAAELARAEETSKLKSEFLSMMSHEIRTPLNAIIGIFELIEQTTEDERQMRRARHGRDAAEGLFKMLSKVLDASRLDAGQTEIIIEPTILSEFSIYLSDVMEGALSKSGGAVVGAVEFDDSLPRELMTDIGALRQIVVNMIDNAVRFTEQGYIKVRAFISKVNGNLAIRFEVSDTGCGISEHDAKIIFDEFRQVDGSMTRKAGGSGLGLTISRKLAQRLGGVLDFHSNLGVGSTFYVDIPLVPQTSE